MSETATMAKTSCGNPTRIGIVSVYAQSIPSFRGDLIKEMCRRGTVVYVLASDYNDTTRAAVCALGAIPVSFTMTRTGMNPLRDIRDTILLALKMRSLRLDSVFCYFIKPVIYGSIAAWIARVPLRIAMIEGAGYVFTDSEKTSLSRHVLRRAVALLYKGGLLCVKRVFMLNPDDAILFTSRKMVAASKVVLLNGIGLDLNHYQQAPLPSLVGRPFRFLFVGRLLREKGVYDYVEAAKAVRKYYPEAQFALLGSVDENPGAIAESEVQRWVRAGIVEWPGQVADVRTWIRDASVFVLPSYREGLPRSTQEVMAMGRPVITTDVPGCRETVVDGKNGFLVPVRDPEALAQAMLMFLRNPSLAVQMGAASRVIAEEKFDVSTINAKILKEMEIR